MTPIRLYPTHIPIQSLFSILHRDLADVHIECFVSDAMQFSYLTETYRDSLNFQVGHPYRLETLRHPHNPDQFMLAFDVGGTTPFSDMMEGMGFGPGYMGLSNQPQHSGTWGLDRLGLFPVAVVTPKDDAMMEEILRYGVAGMDCLNGGPKGMRLIEDPDDPNALDPIPGILHDDTELRQGPPTVIVDPVYAVAAYEISQRQPLPALDRNVDQGDQRVMARDITPCFSRPHSEDYLPLFHPEVFRLAQHYRVHGLPADYQWVRSVALLDPALLWLAPLDTPITLRTLCKLGDYPTGTDLEITIREDEHRGRAIHLPDGTVIEDIAIDFAYLCPFALVCPDGKKPEWARLATCLNLETAYHTVGAPLTGDIHV